MNVKTILKALGSIIGGVATAKIFWDQTEELSKECKKYNRELEQSITEFRKKFDNLQLSCDRLTLETAGAILQKAITAELPVPTTAELKACNDKDERLKMWNTMLTNVLARTLCVPYAETLAFLCSRIQASLLYAKAYCPEKAARPNGKNDDDESDEDEDEMRDNVFREYMKTFNILRSKEYIFCEGFKCLSVIAKDAAELTIKSEGITLDKQIDYENTFKLLLSNAFEQMNIFVYEKMPLLISPLNALNTEAAMKPDEKMLHEFTSEIATSNDFFFILNMGVRIYLMYAYRSAYQIFESKATKDETTGAAVLRPVASVLPRLLKIADSMAEVPTMGPIFQTMGSIERIDALMYEIYRGLITP